MSEISLKSITGITSITTPAGVDNQLTVHNNNTTEAVKFDNAGNVHVNNQLEVSGFSTFAGITTNTSTLFTNELRVAGLSSFSGNLHSSGKLTINPDDNTTTWKRENKNMHQIRDDVYVEGTVNVGDKAGFDATPLGITTFTWVSAGTSYYSLTTNVAHAIPQGTNVLIKDSVSGFQEAYNTTSGAGTTITVERAIDPSSELSVANTKVVVYTPADPRGCLNVAKNYAKVIENGFNPILRGFVGSSTTHPVGINTEVFKIEIKRDGTEEDSVATLLHSTRQMGSKQRLALTIDDGKSYPQGKNLVLTQTGVKINADDSAFSDANALLEVDGNVAIGITTPGKLGIGTHNPLTLLHLKSDDPTLRIQRHNQSAYGEITVDTAGKITLKSDPGNAANGDGFSFTVNNSEKLSIDSSGNIDANGDLDVDGHTNLDNVSIAGISTFSGIVDAVNTPASIRVAQDIQHKGDATTKISFPTNGEISFDTSGHDRIYIKSNGYVGINSTSPAAYLDIGAHNTGNPTLHVKNHTAAGTFTNIYGSEFRHATNSAVHAMLIHNQESVDARRTLDISDANGIFATFTNGKVGIGTVIPATKLDVRGSSDASITIGLNNGTKYGNFSCDNSQTYLYAYNGNDIVFSTHSGNSFNKKATIKNDGKIFINHTSNSNATVVIAGLTDNTHPVIKVKGTQVNGYTLLGDEYTTDESQFTMGCAYSAASFVLGWGVKVSTSANNTYQSSQDTYSTRHGAIKYDGSGLRYLTNTSNQTVTRDSAVTLTERLNITYDGQLIQKANKASGYVAEFHQDHTSNSAQILIDSPTNSASRPAFIELSRAGTLQWSFGQGYNNSVGAFHFATSTLGSGVTGSKFSIEADGDIAIPTVGAKIYTNNSGGNLTIQGGASYPGSAIKFNGGTNGGTGVMHFYAGQASSLEERMVIKSDGKIGMSQSSPNAATLHIGNSVASSGSNVALQVGTISGQNRYLTMSHFGGQQNFYQLKMRVNDNQLIPMLDMGNPYGSQDHGTKIKFSGYNDSEVGAIESVNTASNSTSSVDMVLRTGSGPKEVLRLQSNGDARFYNGLYIAKVDNDNSNFSRSGFFLGNPAISEYVYTWSGHSSYTIDLTCASYFSCVWEYFQHQTNGGSRMQQYARGKWSNNHYQHTLNVWEWSGSGGGLSVSFTASDQSGNGSINGLSNMSNNGSTYSGFTNGGGEGSSSTANGRFRISETYNWGSVSSRALIVRVSYGSFNISKS